MSPAPSAVAPHDFSLEQAVLGATLHSAAALRALVAEPSVDALFYIDAHRAIALALGDLARSLNGATPDRTLVRAATATRGVALDDAQLLALDEAGFLVADVTPYVAQLRELAAQREEHSVFVMIAAATRTDAPASPALWAAVRQRLTSAETWRTRSGAAEPALRTLSWREMTAEPAAPIAYHWDGWVPQATVALLAGAGEALKSWLALLLAVCTAAGRVPFVDTMSGTDATPLTAGPVLYFTAENGIEEEKRRATLLKAGLGLPDELPLTFVPSEFLNLSNDADWAAVVALVTQLCPVAIFIDSAIAVSGLAEENDNPTVRRFMKTRVLPLARVYGCTVYLLVHSPKPPTQPGARLGDEHLVRGAGDWRNAADIVLSLKRDPSLGPHAVVLKHAKVRIGRRHAPLWFSLEDVTADVSVRVVLGGAFDEDTQQATAPGLVRAIQQLVKVLKDVPDGLSLKDATAALGAAQIAPMTARRALDVVRGRQPWPHSQHAGKRHPIVTEGKRGRLVWITLNLTETPNGMSNVVGDDEPDDA